MRLGEGLRRERRCLFDTWTRQFVQHWGEDGLDSEDAEVDCLATASMMLSDTSVIEARHASIRRSLVLASTQTHCELLERASSEFVYRQVPRMSAATRRQKRSRDEAEHDEVDPQVGQPEAKRALAEKLLAAEAAKRRRVASGHIA